MTPDLLQTVGVALYGARWQSDMARDLEVSDRTVRRWLAGQEIPQGVRDDLRRNAVRRLTEIELVIAQLR